VPVSSSTSDNEHTPSSLRDGARVRFHSHELRVENSVGEPIPEFCHPPEQGTKIPSSVRRQDTWDVLPDGVPRLDLVDDGEPGEREVSSLVCESFAETGDGEGLTGRSAHENIN
jgi:hypothetical protein